MKRLYNHKVKANTPIRLDLTKHNKKALSVDTSVLIGVICLIVGFFGGRYFEASYSVDSITNDCVEFATVEGWRSYEEGKAEVIEALQLVDDTKNYNNDTFYHTGLREDSSLIYSILN